MQASGMAALGPGSPPRLVGDKCWPATPELDFFHIELELSHLVLNETPPKAFVFTPINVPLYLKSSCAFIPELHFLWYHGRIWFSPATQRDQAQSGHRFKRKRITWSYTVRVGNYSYRNNLEQRGWIFWGHKCQSALGLDQ